MQVAEELLRFDTSTIPQDHGETNLFAEPLVGDREGGTAGDRGVAHRHILDPRRMNVVATPDDQVLLAADDIEAALVVEPAEIAAHEPSRSVERLLGRLLVVEIPQRQAGAAPTDLADRTCRRLDVGVVLVPDPDLVGPAGAPASLDDG